MANRLEGQSSPYLLQHKDNLVDWYPWGEEAFERAAREDKPIFLSIGYSTCHWCHVMAHESFENEAIAEILNRDFVSVKVDREERPDIDSVYMSVCVAMTGGGGWPMSIFMTAEQKPFFAGTYFPPEARYGQAGFRELLLFIAEKWRKERAGLLDSAEQILAHLKKDDSAENARVPAGWELPELAAKMFSRQFDPVCGGFGNAPKFPMPHNLLFLTLYARLASDPGSREEARREVEITLRQMYRGGIFDQIGGGFSRYSTDRYFLVPHFEKMLYDNALLILAYASAYKAFGERSFLTAAEETAQYVLREMTGPGGEFYCAQDADSEGEEGLFYVWTKEEVCGVLGEERGTAFCRHYGITEEGNFEGKNIPNRLSGMWDGREGRPAAGEEGERDGQRFEKERELLYVRRLERARLHLDDKVLTSWNSLMICAMATLYRVTGNPRYLSAAENAVSFIEKNLVRDGALYVSCREKAVSVPGFLDDYAFYAAALISLSAEKPDLLSRASEICRRAEEQFADGEGGGYFLYGKGNSPLITRPKETYDGAVPSGNSVMAYCLVRLYQLTGEEWFQKKAERQITYLSACSADVPSGHSMFLLSLLFYLSPPPRITVVLSGKESESEIRARLPLYADITILPREEKGCRLLRGETTYYVCRDNVCLPPSNEL